MRENVDELTIPLEDGRVVLAADLMYPSQPVGPRPVLISMYLYHKDDVIGSTFEGPRRLLASSGYATLLVDMRGHGASSGSPAAAYDLGGVEVADGEAVVEWAAAQECRWWDRHLPAAPGTQTDHAASGRPPPPVTEPNVLMYVNGAARWRAYADWPPPTEAIVLFLSSNGHLELSPGDVGAEVAFQSGGLTGRTPGLLDPLGTGLGLPEDQHDDDMASLTFETEGLTADLALAGRPHLDLTVAVVPAMDLRLVARICDVSADGRSTLLTSGWTRVLRSPQDKSETAVQVCCAPVAAVVLAGHRLRVSISSSDFPRMWPTTDGGDFSVVVGGPLASRIALPRPGAPENRQGWDDDGGEDWTDRVPRPASATTPAWSVSGSAALRQIREVPGPIMETDIETRSEVRTPRGATLLVNEKFRAAASALNPQDARVFGDVRFVIELGDGSKVDVGVESLFTERTSLAKAQVTLDGTPVLDEVWQTPALVEDNSGTTPKT